MQALVKYLDNVSDEDIPSLEIPTGVPLIYELDDDLKPIRHYYVGWVFQSLTSPNRGCHLILTLLSRFTT